MAVLADIRDELGFPGAFPTAWCAERPDWYAAEYIANAQFGFSSLSGNWNKWSRDPQTGLQWIGPDQTGYPNRFGPACQGTFSWCTEDGLGSVPSRVVRPSFANCELFYQPWGGCSTGMWRLTIRIGPDRQRTCEF